MSPSALIQSGTRLADKASGYAVGQGGLIFRTSDGGNTWSKQNSGTQADLYNVIAAGPDEAWAVGEDGTLLVTYDGGRQRQQQDVGTKGDIYAVALKAGEVWIATSDGNILHAQAH